VSDRDFEALRSAAYTDAEMIEVVANVAFNIFTNYLNLVARTEVDFPVLKPGEDMPLAASSEATV
jgi:hypothetical protein